MGVVDLHLRKLLFSVMPLPWSVPLRGSWRSHPPARIGHFGNSEADFGNPAFCRVFAGVLHGFAGFLQGFYRVSSSGFIGFSLARHVDPGGSQLAALVESLIFLRVFLDSFKKGRNLVVRARKVRNSGWTADLGTLHFAGFLQGFCRVFAGCLLCFLQASNVLTLPAGRAGVRRRAHPLRHGSGM